MTTKEQKARQYARIQCDQASEECYTRECTCRPLIGDIARIRQAAFEAGWQACEEQMKKVTEQKYRSFTHEGRTYRQINAPGLVTCKGCCFDKNEYICTHPFFDEKELCNGKIYKEIKEEE